MAEGVGPGDRVIVYMPMVPEAVVAMLACARIGAVHSVVFGGFAAHELASRIEDATPKVIVSASCGIEPSGIVPYKPLLDAAISMSDSKPERCIILQRPMLEADLDPPRDVEWSGAVFRAVPAACASVEATDPLYILYTSGTTGQPKGIVRDNGGHAVALAWTMKHVYDVEPGEVFWAASDVGWVVGHSYIVYGPLFHGATTVLYEGKPVGTPDPGAFSRVIADHGVCTLFTAPTAFRAIRQQDPEGAHIRRLRPVRFSRALPRRRAYRSGHTRMGTGKARCSCDRPLVADRDRVGDRRNLPRYRAAAGSAGVGGSMRTGMGLARPGNRRSRMPERGDWGVGGEASDASRGFTHPLERERALP